MAEPKIVSCDLDDVIFPLHPATVESLNQRFGCNLSMDNYLIFSVTSWLKLKHPEVSKLLEESGGKIAHFKYMGRNGYLTNTPPCPGSINALTKLKEKGKKIAIVTFRGTEEEPDLFYDNGPEITRQWLRSFGLEYDFLKFAKDKAKALREIEEESRGRVIIHIDDHPGNILDVVKAGYMAAVLDKSYNQPKLIESDNLGRDGLTNQIWRDILESGKVYRVNHVSELVNLI